MELRGGEQLMANARAQADRWTERQAERLGIAPQQVLDAIGRGWFSEAIERVPASAVECLEGPPLALRRRPR